MSTWKDKLIDLDTQVPMNLDEIEQSSQEAKVHDIGLINPASGAGILVRDNGRVESFADYGLGFRFDPATQSLSIFAPHVRLFTKDFKQIEDPSTYFQDEYQDVLDLIHGSESDD